MRRSALWEARHIVVAALLLWGAAAVAVQVESAAPGIAAGGVVAIGATVFSAWRWPGRTTTVAVLVAVALIAIGGSVAMSVASRDAARALVTTTDVVQLRAIVTGAVTGAPERRWMDAVGTLSGPDGTSAPVAVRVGAAASGSLMMGSEISGAFRGFAADPGDRAAVVVVSDDEPAVSAPASGWLDGIGVLRADLIDGAAALPQPGGALVAGLAVGDTSAVSAELEADMRTSSLAHLTAVSGANCAIVVGAAFAAAAAFGARRGVRVAVAMTALVLFVVLVTPEPSVVRAAVMAALAMMGVALGRPGLAVGVLASAVAVLLCVDPWLALELGFALSVAATAALLLVAPGLTRGLGRALPLPIAALVGVPLAAQLACTPLLVLVDPRLPVLGVPANILVAPAAPLATVLGLLACLAAPVPPVQGLLLHLAWLPAAWIAAVATASASIPAASLAWLPGMLGAGAALVLSIAITVALVVARPRVRTWAAAGAVAVCAVSAGETAVQTVLAPLTVPREWQVVACDVGQGDAILLRSGGAVALVDTGDDPAALASCLDRAGVTRLDMLVLTHFDVDHVGAAEELVGRADVVMHGPAREPEEERLLDAFASGGADLVLARAGMTGMLGSVRWRVRWPRSTVVSGNDASVVVEVRGERFPSVVLLGDLSASAQQALRAAAGIAVTDVVKVAHHGSADQDAALYAALAAPIAVLSVGADNDYGHPTREILRVLTSTGTTVARTDTEGMLAVWRDDAGLALWRERAVGGGG